LKVDLVCADHRIDLIAEGIDVAVRLGKLGDSGHMASRIGTLRRWLVASPAIAGTACPQARRIWRPAGDCADGGGAADFLHAGKAAGVTHEVRLQNIVFSTNTAYASRAAALAGDGLLRATTFSVQDDVAAGRLVRVLPSGRCPRAISTRSTLPPRTCRRKCASSSTR
jgi:DNA-binding transcriptional LysR family regulator